jgi:hypothetical protein
MHKLRGMTTTAVAVALSLASSVLAADSDAVMMNPSDVKWGPAPPNLGKGPMLAVLYGDPGKPGPFVMRLKSDKAMKIAPHWHSNAEVLTIISGTFYLGSGDKADASKAHALKTGGFHYLPAKAHHYAFSKGAVIVQVNGEGPFDLTYVNPDDDPSRAPAKK